MDCIPAKITIQQIIDEDLDKTYLDSRVWQVMIEVLEVVIGFI